jgi:hypothetical protein
VTPLSGRESLKTQRATIDPSSNPFEPLLKLKEQQEEEERIILKEKERLRKAKRRSTIRMDT